MRINDSLTLSTIELGDFIASGSIGAANATVDIAASIAIPQTTPGIDLTLPAPTVATAGRLLLVFATGSADVKVEGTNILAGTAAIFQWNGTAWGEIPVGGHDFWRSGAGGVAVPDGRTDATEAIRREGAVGIKIDPLSDMDVAGTVAVRPMLDFSTVGQTDDAAFGALSNVRLTGATSQTITGIAGGSPGRLLVIQNASTARALLTNEDAASAAANRIVTSTGAPVALSAGAVALLQYDAAAQRWRVVSDGSAQPTSWITTTNGMTLEAGRKYILRANDTVELPAGAVGDSVQILPEQADWTTLVATVDLPPGYSFMAQSPINATAHVATFLINAAAQYMVAV